MYCSEVARVVW